jgi:arginyl-tRNA synthetase
MILDLQARLSEAVRSAARRAFDAPLEAVGFSYPPRQELGDLALTAPFDLARSLRRSPREIAGRLAEELANEPGVRRAEVAGGGYVNLFLDRGAFARELHDWLSEERPTVAGGSPVIVEHTSINPNKAAHIGHLRNAVLGDTFVRLLRHLGRSVGIQNYIDDTGVQVADVVVGFLHLEGKTPAQVADLAGRFDHYCWDLYARVGDYYAADPQRRARQAEALHAIEAGDNEVAGLAAHVAARIVDCHLATMERVGIRYDLLVHESDILRQHFWEHAFSRLKQAGAIRLEAEGKNAGCWVLSMDSGGADPGAPAAEASSPPSRDSLPARRNLDDAPERGRGAAAPEGRRFADDDKVIVRSNGTVTYTGKDIAYQLWKLGLLERDFRYRRHSVYGDGHPLWTTTNGDGEPGAPRFGHAALVFNVIDTGQSYPQRVVRAAVAALGHADAAEGSRHLAYEKVVLSPATARALGYALSEDETAVKVSGRKGLGVKADDLLDALVAKAAREVEERDPERPAEARAQAAREIAVGALRYFLLKFQRAKVITFDMDEALAFTGETGPYIQNGVVRARNIFAKLAAEGHDPGGLVAGARRLDLDALLAGEEGDEVWALLLQMARSEEAVDQAVRSEEVATLAKHAFAVAQAFHSYYQKPAHSVLRAESDERRAFRALVVDCFLRQMQTLTGLLGIPVPGRM